MTLATFRACLTCQRRAQGHRHHAAPAAGDAAPESAVYDRAGDPCLRGDGGTVRRIVQAGRGTWYCPRCQRR